MDTHERRLVSRREFGLISAAALAAPLAGCGSNESPAPAAGPQIISSRNRGPGDKLNIVFVFGVKGDLTARVHPKEDYKKFDFPDKESVTSSPQ